MNEGDREAEALARVRQLFHEMLATAPIAPCESPDQIVPGEGSAEARLVIVGEAPGQQEERAHRPFVGPAGRLLRSTLRDKGIDPDSVWITNVVKCRPTRWSAGRRANRAPTRAEAGLWEPWLVRELEILRPRVILCLGNLAANTLIHQGFKMAAEHGEWFDGPFGSKALATYHPAYVLRQIGPEGNEIRRLFAEDIRKVVEEVHQYHRGRRKPRGH